MSAPKPLALRLSAWNTTLDVTARAAHRLTANVTMPCDDMSTTQKVSVYACLWQDESDQQEPHVVQVEEERFCRVAGDDELREFDGILHFPSENTSLRADLSHLPLHLCDGYHVSLVSYGASQTGKSYALFDEEQGAFGPLVRGLFQCLQSRPYQECIIQCSIAELYLECVYDLLRGSRSRHCDGRDDSIENISRIHRGALIGCVALSCVSEEDVLKVVRRGLALRTQAYHCLNTNNPQHSNKSTVVVQLTVQTVDQNDQRKQSRLLVVDCAPTQYDSPGLNGGREMVKSEPMLALHDYVRERIASQAQERDAHYNGPTLSRENVQKLPLIAQLLLYSLGSNCFTTVLVCVASRRSQQKQASKHTLQFGADCRILLNYPVPNVHHPSWQDCLEFQSEMTDRVDKMQIVVRALAEECVRLRSKAGNFLVNKQLWSIIDEITTTNEENGRKLNFITENKTEHEHRVEVMKLRSDLRRAEVERDKAVARASKAKAELTTMKEQAKALNQQYREQRTELENLRSENRALKYRKAEIEHNLRTSLFRESEAVVFLRQFRKFYSRLLHKMAKEGTGDVGSIVSNIPGAPDLVHMFDIDRMMVESGLLEEEEVGKDNAPKDYRPSRAALQSSYKALEDAEVLLESERVGKRTVLGIADVELSIVVRPETGEMTEARQRLFQTPSGRYIAMREKDMESELLKLSEKCMSLQGLLEEEKAKVKALSVGVDANTITKAAQDLKLVQEKLRKKEKDWQAVILKMNELHLSSKDARDKIDNREQHVIYLEASLAEAHRQHAELIAEMTASEKYHVREHEQLSDPSVDISGPIWQYGDSQAETLPWPTRIVVPFSTVKDSVLFDAERRQSLNEADRWFDTYFTSRSSSTAQTVDSAEGTLDGSLSKAAKNMNNGGIDALIFMEDGDTKNASVASEEEGVKPMDDLRSSSHYKNFVDAYTSASAPTNLKVDQGHTEQPDNGVNKLVLADDKLSDTVHSICSSSQALPSTPEAATQEVKEAVKQPVKEPMKPKVASNSIIERLKAKAEAAARREGAEDDGVPEWMKKFKKIGAKNANEEVLETQGAGGVREFGRTPWETLKLNDRKTPAAEMYATSTIKWTPRVKHGSDSDSDDEQFAGYPSYSPYIGGAPITFESDSDGDDKTTAENEMIEEKSIVVSKETESEFDRNPITTRAPTRRGSDSDTSSNSETSCKRKEQPLVPRMSQMKRESDSDSDSSDEESLPAKRPQNHFLGASVDPGKSATSGVAVSRSRIDSDSESDSSAESYSKKYPPIQIAPVEGEMAAAMKAVATEMDSNEQSLPKLTLPLTASASVPDGTDSDSDSNEDSEEDSKPMTSFDAPRKIDGDSSSSSEDSGLVRRQITTNSPPPSRQESESESSEDSVPKRTATVSRAKATASGASESDSDSDSSEISSQVPSTATHAVPSKTPPAVSKDDSESDSNSSDGSTPEPAASKIMPAPPKTSVRKDDSDSDSDSSDDSVPATTKPPAHKVDEEDDGFGGWSKPVQKTIVGGKPKPTSRDSDDEDESTRQSPVRTSSSTLTRTVLTKKSQPDGDVKDKQMFVIMNGKLVKSNSRSDLMAPDAGTEKKNKKGKGEKKVDGKKKVTAKPAFVIVDGKLVKTEAGGTDNKKGSKKGGDKEKKRKKG